MTENQDKALRALRDIKHWLEKLAHLDDNEPLNPVLKERTRQEMESAARLYTWLFNSLTRGDTFQKGIDTPKPKE